MILAWLRTPRSRQAALLSDFSRRKPVAVRTTPAAPSAQPGERGRRAFGPAQPATGRSRVGVASLSPTQALTERHEYRRGRAPQRTALRSAHG
jgi:hypothetical protein